MKITPEFVNDWRIVPRLIICLYGYAFWEVVQWFMTLEEPISAQAMFVSTVVGAAPAFFGLYVNSGKLSSEFKKGDHDGSP